MKSITKQTHNIPQRRFHSEMHYPCRRNDISFNSVSDGCLMTEFRDIVRKLFMSNPENREYESVSEYFKDILRSTSNHHREFEKLDSMFFSRENLSFLHSRACPEKYTSEDIVYLHMSVMSVLEMISNVKDELIFREHHTSKVGRRSLNKTKSVINELEIKLVDLLNNLEEIKNQLPYESQRDTLIDLRKNTVPGRQAFSLNTCTNGHCKPTFTCYKECQCIKKHVTENPFSKLNRKNVINVTQTNRNTGTQRLSYTKQETQENKSQCKTLHNRNKFKKPVRQENLERSSELRTPILTQLYAREPLNAFDRPPYVASRDQLLKNCIIVTSKLTNDVRNKRKNNKVKKKRRTRAGDDHVRRCKSHFQIYTIQNQESISKHSIPYFSEIYYDNDVPLRVKKNNSVSRFLSKGINRKVRNCRRMINENKKAYIVLSETQSEVDYVKKSETSINSYPYGITHNFKTNESRLASGANYSSFSINRSPQRHRKRKRRTLTEHNRGNLAMRSPGSFRMNSSKPRKTKRKSSGRRKRVRRHFATRPRLESINQYKKERRFQRTSMPTKYRPPSNSISSFYSLPSDEYFGSCSPSLEYIVNRNYTEPYIPYELDIPYETGCPTDFSYPPTPINWQEYQQIQDPTYSNTCCTQVPPVQAQPPCIQFERPRKKKIVKRYIHIKKPVYVEQVLESQSSTQTSSSSTSVTFSLETEPQETSTENVSTVETGTTTSQVITAVKAVATNTPGVSKHNIGVNTIPQKPPHLRPIETMSRYTNTEKLKSRTIGTDAKPITKEAKARMINKATDTPYVRKGNKETNTTPERKRNVKETGTNPRPEMKRRAVNVGTDSLKPKLQSKSTNTTPIKETIIQKPLSVSKGTQVVPIQTKEKDTSYEKVNTREDGTKEVKNEEQQFEFIKPLPVISEAEFTKPNISHKQELKSQRLEQLQTLGKQPLRYQQLLTKELEKENVQYLSKEHARYIQNLSNQPVAHSQMRMDLDIKHTQHTYPQLEKHLQTMNNQPLGQIQVTEIQKLEQRQTVSKQSQDYIQRVSQEPQKHAQTLTHSPVSNMQNISRQKAKYVHTLRNQHTHRKQIVQIEKQGFISTYEPRSPTKEIQNYDRPYKENIQTVSKKGLEVTRTYQPPALKEHVQKTSVGKPEFTSTYEPQPSKEQVQINLIKKPEFTCTYEPQAIKEKIQIGAIKRPEFTSIYQPQSSKEHIQVTSVKRLGLTCTYKPQSSKEQIQMELIKRPGFTCKYEPQSLKEHIQMESIRRPEPTCIYEPQSSKEHIQMESIRRPELTCIYEPQSSKEHIQMESIKGPELTCIYEPQSSKEHIQMESIRRPGFTCTYEPPAPIRLKETSSDISMHLTLEKVHEEIFRKRCRFCKCITKCKCKCCNRLYFDRKKVVVCEKKKSNTIRVTNRSDCQINPNEGEEIISDIDVEISFNIDSSPSALCFTNNKVYEHLEKKKIQSLLCNDMNKRYCYANYCGSIDTDGWGNSESLCSYF